MIFSLLILFLFAILPLAIIIMIIIAIVKKGKNGGNPSLKLFEKSIRSIYTYIILICLLCIIIGGTIYLFNSALNLALPEETSDSDISYYTSTLTRTRNSNIVGIFTSSAMLVSCVPVFIYFNKIAKKDD